MAMRRSDANGEPGHTAGFWLSPQQRCVWSLQNDSRVYGSACMLIFEGVESPDSLAAVTEHLVARHETASAVAIASKRNTGNKKIERLGAIP